MKREDYRKVLEQRGYEIVSDGMRPCSFWVKTGPGNQRLVNVEEMFERERSNKERGRMVGIESNSDEMSLGGKPRYNPHDLKELNPDRIPVIEDYACETGRQRWKDYYVERDSHGNITREGPRPFRNRAERRAYERLTNQRWRDE